MKYCVYKITNKITGKAYIGMTKNVSRRWGRGSGYKKQPLFYEEIKKFGWDNFSKEIIAEGLSKEEAIAIEAQMISNENTIHKGYNISNGMRDMVCSPKIKVDKYDPKTGKLICTYESISDAANELNTSDSHISEACNGKHSVIAGYGWTYHGEPYTKPDKITMMNKRVLMIEKDTGIVLKSFRNAVEAADFVGCSKSIISMCCNGKLRTGLGYVWRFE